MSTEYSVQSIIGWKITYRQLGHKKFDWDLIETIDEINGRLRKSFIHVVRKDSEPVLYVGLRIRHSRVCDVEGISVIESTQLPGNLQDLLAEAARELRDKIPGLAISSADAKIYTVLDVY